MFAGVSKGVTLQWHRKLVSAFCVWGGGGGGGAVRFLGPPDRWGAFTHLRRRAIPAREFANWSMAMKEVERTAWMAPWQGSKWAVL